MSVSVTPISDRPLASASVCNLRVEVIDGEEWVAGTVSLYLTGPDGEAFNGPGVDLQLGVPGSAGDTLADAGDALMRRALEVFRRLGAANDEEVLALLRQPSEAPLVDR